MSIYFKISCFIIVKLYLLFQKYHIKLHKSPPPIEVFPTLFFPQKRLIRSKPCMWVLWKPLKFSIEIPSIIFFILKRQIRNILFENFNSFSHMWRRKSRFEPMLVKVFIESHICQSYLNQMKSANLISFIKSHSLTFDFHKFLIK